MYMKNFKNRDTEIAPCATLIVDGVRSFCGAKTEF